MLSRMNFAVCRFVVAILIFPAAVIAQQPPYDVFPPADPPFYRVRYDASTEPGRAHLSSQLHRLDSARCEKTARRYRASTRLRRRIVQIGTDGRI